MQTVHTLQIRKLNSPQEPQKLSKASNKQSNDRLPYAHPKLSQGQRMHLDSWINSHLLCDVVLFSEKQLHLQKYNTKL